MVAKHCFRVGMYWQGLTHDLSKYSPAEFWQGVRYYQGYRSPNNAEREAKGYSSAWLHHKGRNKHHYEYWIDYSCGPVKGMTGMKMPLKYVNEMIMDRIAASKVYEGKAYTQHSPLRYYEMGKDAYMIHPETRALLAAVLTMLDQEGEEKTFAYMRTHMVGKKEYPEIQELQRGDKPDPEERGDLLPGAEHMKYAYQIMIIGGISFAGEVLNKCVPLPVPASVYGMLLLLLCLCMKWIRIEQIQETADFLLAAMPLVFVGPGVALMESFGLMKGSLGVILFISIVSTALVMTVTGLTAQMMVRRKRNKEESEND